MPESHGTSDAASAVAPSSCPTCGHPLFGIEERLRSEVLRALNDSTYTQKWLAEQVGITEKHMSQMLTGKVSLTVRLAEAMLAALGRMVAIHVSEINRDHPEEGR